MAAVSQLDEKRPAGRPRSEQARKAILDATARLLESATLKSLAIESIAREAGVGKATIYRWWPNKAAIVIDAFFREVEQRTAFEHAPTATEAIRHQVARMVRAIAGTTGRIAAQIIAEGQSDPSVLEHFRAVFLRQRRAAATEIFRNGIANGEFHDDLDIELAIDLIYGPIWYRLMVGHQPLDATFAECLPRLSISALVKTTPSGIPATDGHNNGRGILSMNSGFGPTA
ncbi:MAG: TetR/AcrR family transcriptional regulator [Gammaproteobacteria bacterium]|nr:TetR/AcrR family transcriptional regulator [Gammaproteobacteria bacterium]